MSSTTSRSPSCPPALQSGETNTIGKRKEEEEEDRIKEKIRRATEAWQTYYEKEEEDTDEEERSEQEAMNTIKKHGSSKSCSNRDIHQARAGGNKREEQRRNIHNKRLYSIRCELGTICRVKTRRNIQGKRESR